MYAWHLKKVQIKHMPILYSAFLIIVFVLWNYLKQIPDTASEEQLKSAFLLAQATGIFLLIGCQILDLIVFFERGARAITASYQKRIFLWDVFSFVFFLLVVSLVVIRFLYNKRAMCKGMVCDDSSVGFHAHADFYIVLYKTFHIGGCSSWSCTYCG